MCNGPGYMTAVSSPKLTAARSAKLIGCRRSNQRTLGVVASSPTYPLAAPTRPPPFAEVLTGEGPDGGGLLRSKRSARFAARFLGAARSLSGPLPVATSGHGEGQGGAELDRTPRIALACAACRTKDAEGGVRRKSCRFARASCVVR